MIRTLSERRALNEFREGWPERKTHSRTEKSYSFFYGATAANTKDGVVDDKTWHDLDFNSIFQMLDSTVSSIGQQFLYKRLRVFNEAVEDLKREHKVAKVMQQNSRLREELQLCLRHMGFGDASPVTKLLFSNGSLTSLPKAKVLGWTAISLTLLALIVIVPSPIWILLLVIINFVVSRYFENKTDQATYTMSYIYKMVCVADRIVNIKITEDLSAIRELQKSKKEIKQVKKLMQLVSFSQNSDSLLVSNLMYLINLLFPYDWLVYHFSVEFILGRLEVLRTCYQSIGEIDSSIAIGSYIERNTRLCNPEVTDCDTMEFENAYHPLVENCNPNSVVLRGNSALITGSNMAGKTTFIKTIGVNFILSRTLWLCHADTARIPKFDIYTSIKTSDSLVNGKSFYFSELERIKLFLNRSSSRRCLLIIDEIFRGTNTIERIAGAAAVIDELAESNIVIVTTHDRELATILKTKIDMYYFEETGNYKSPFDYKLRAGVCKSRNALKLMEGLGYPKHVIRRAVCLSEEVARLVSD